MLVIGMRKTTRDMAGSQYMIAVKLGTCKAQIRKDGQNDKIQNLSLFASNQATKMACLQFEISFLLKVAIVFSVVPEHFVNANVSSQDLEVPTIPPSLKINDALAEFSVELYKQAVHSVKNTGNFLISPLSIYTVLAMLRVGARNKCKTQMEDVLRLSNINDVDSEILKLSTSLLAENKTVIMANKVWQQKWFCFTPCKTFIKNIELLFQGELEELNFFGNSDEAANTINQWAYEKSGGRIKRLVEKEEINWNTRFVLSNVVVFKSAWKRIFLKKYTSKQKFTALVDGLQKEKHVTTMFTVGKFRYTHGYGIDYRTIEFPYQEENFSMFVILPNTARLFNKLERSINTIMLGEIVEHLQLHPATDVLVSMPKFRIENSFTLNKVLQTMGMTDIFSKKDADLSNIVGFRGMYVTSVRHEAMIKVDEFGSEAAGGSSISTGDLSLSDFRINKPFLFFIQHKPTGSFLFFGKVINPGF